jgi:hypothetical protein
VTDLAASYEKLAKSYGVGCGPTARAPRPRRQGLSGSGAGRGEGRSFKPTRTASYSCLNDVVLTEPEAPSDGEGGVLQTEADEPVVTKPVPPGARPAHGGARRWAEAGRGWVGDRRRSCSIRSTWRWRSHSRTLRPTKRRCRPAPAAPPAAPRARWGRGAGGAEGGRGEQDLVPPEERMTIVICSSEIAPFSKSGGLADVCDKLGVALSRMGHRVMTIAPLYWRYDGVQNTGVWKEFGVSGQKMRAEYWHKFRETVPAKGDRPAQGVDHVFVQQGCFERHGMYGHGDDLQRFTLLSWAALEAPFAVDCGGSPYGDDVVFLVNDWMVGLIPLIMTSHYRRYKCYEKARVLFNIHNMGYCGNFGKVPPESLGLPNGDFYDLLFHDNQIKLLKGGIELADRVVTVSPTYRDEIITPEVRARPRAASRPRCVRGACGRVSGAAGAGAGGLGAAGHVSPALLAARWCARPPARAGRGARGAGQAGGVTGVGRGRDPQRHRHRGVEPDDRPFPLRPVPGALPPPRARALGEGGG